MEKDFNETLKRYYETVDAFNERGRQFFERYYGENYLRCHHYEKFKIIDDEIILFSDYYNEGEDEIVVPLDIFCGENCFEKYEEYLKKEKEREKNLRIAELNNYIKETESTLKNMKERLDKLNSEDN